MCSDANHFKTFKKKHNQYAQQIPILRAVDFGDCLQIGLVWTISFGEFLLTGIREIDLGYCLFIGTARTIDLEGGLLIGIVQPIAFVYCLLMGIAAQLI